MKLHVSDNFALPLDFVTQSQAILAKRGAGKTNTAVVQVEELLKAGQQVVVVDPTGAWWGLKSSADGKHEGFPVVIFGGEHADVPLEEGAGEIVAQAIVEQRFAAIIDLSLLRKGAMHRFMSVFLETLYRLNREAMHLVVDEADSVAPQKPFGEEARTLGAMQDIVRRGRIRGIGCTLITQRPQVLNKDVLTQCEVLCTLRLSHPKDIGAIKEWIAVHGDEQTAKDMITSLPSLPIGTAWFWSPGWGEFFERVPVRRRETFDSSATPKPGEVRRAPKVTAHVDLKALGEQIQSTVERQKENDPKELKARLAKLQRELEQRQTSEPVVDQAVIAHALKELADQYEKQIEGLHEDSQRLRDEMESIARCCANALAGIPRVDIIKPVITQTPRPLVPKPWADFPKYTEPKATRPVSNGTGEKLPKAERTILAALAQYPQGRTKVQCALLGSYSHSGGGFNNAIGALRGKGFIEGNESLRITREGIKALGHFTPLPTGRELLDHWYRNLGKAERTILQVVTSRWPRTISKEDVAAQANYEANGGGFNNALGRLRAFELISGKGELKASDDLFN